MAAYTIDDARDEGPLADLTSAGMWTTAGLIGASMFLLPGAPHQHLAIGLAIAAVAVLWGGTSLVLWHKRWTMSIAQRAVVTAGTAPLVTAAIWASGGASSFLQPLLLFTAMFVSYFFPARLAWPLMGLFAAVYSSPLAYAPDAIAENFPARALGFAIALAGATVVMQLLKRRLVRAEERQRTMAERDPLTDLHSRRSFVAAVEEGPAGVARLRGPAPALSHAAEQDRVLRPPNRGKLTPGGNQGRTHAGSGDADGRRGGRARTGAAGDGE
jgi:hypothetical protein